MCCGVGHGAPSIGCGRSRPASRDCMCPYSMRSKRAETEVERHAVTGRWHRADRLRGLDDVASGCHRASRRCRRVHGRRARPTTPSSERAAATLKLLSSKIVPVYSSIAVTHASVPCVERSDDRRVLVDVGEELIVAPGSPRRCALRRTGWRRTCRPRSRRPLTVSRHRWHVDAVADLELEHPEVAAVDDVCRCCRGSCRRGRRVAAAGDE